MLRRDKEIMEERKLSESVEDQLLAQTLLTLADIRFNEKQDNWDYTRKEIKSDDILRLVKNICDYYEVERVDIDTNKESNPACPWSYRGYSQLVKIAGMTFVFLHHINAPVGLYSTLRLVEQSEIDNFIRDQSKK